MAYDEGLAQRINEYFDACENTITKKMFGGLCFMQHGHMCCGIVGDLLMARVGLENYTNYLNMPYVKEMDFTGKSMKGMIYVHPEGLEDANELFKWITVCEKFVATLPAKKLKN